MKRGIHTLRYHCEMYKIEWVGYVYTLHVLGWLVQYEAVQVGAIERMVGELVHWVLSAILVRTVENAV